MQIDREMRGGPRDLVAEVMERRGRVRKSCSETDSAGYGDCTGEEHRKQAGKISGLAKQDGSQRPGIDSEILHGIWMVEDLHSRFECSSSL